MIVHWPEQPTPPKFTNDGRKLHAKKHRQFPSRRVSDRRITTGLPTAGSGDRLRPGGPRWLGDLASATGICTIAYSQVTLASPAASASCENLLRSSSNFLRILRPERGRRRGRGKRRCRCRCRCRCSRRRSRRAVTNGRPLINND